MAWFQYEYEAIYERGERIIKHRGLTYGEDRVDAIRNALASVGKAIRENLVSIKVRKRDLGKKTSFRSSDDSLTQ